MQERLEAELSDRYAIGRELGRGGMATVWIARDLRHERPVAIKVLHAELAGAIGVDRFVREVRLTARLRHPGVVPVLDSGVLPATSDPALPWYAMPYVQGESLRARLSRATQLPVEEAVRIARDVASALHAAHADGIVHRDIKPENILLEGERTYVLDFGIAKALLETGDDRLTSTGLAIGTPSYMSPEQATASPVDARTDQYSLAAVLYEMLAGEPPATGPTAHAVLARRLSEPARPIRTVRPTVPEHVERAVLRALERVPADRFDDVAAFADALLDTTASAAMPRARRRPRAFIAIALGALLVLAGSAWGILGRTRGHAAPAPDPELLALHQRGMRGYEERTTEGAIDAIRSFRAAIARDSTFARAWAGLAQTWVRVDERRFTIPGIGGDSVLRLAVAAADRALALDSTMASAWTARAIVSRKLDPTDVRPSMQAARRALAIDSSDAKAWHVLAVGHAEQGDLGAAIATWREEVRRNPRYAEGLVFLAIGHFWHRQLDSAAVWSDSALAVDPTFYTAWQVAGDVARERGDYERALAAHEAARRLTTDVEVINTLAGRATAEAMSGRAAEAHRTLRIADSLSRAFQPPPTHHAVWIAGAWSALGDTARALEWLARYPQPRDLHFQIHVRCDPRLAALAGSARYEALLRPVPGARC